MPSVGQSDYLFVSLRVFLSIYSYASLSLSKSYLIEYLLMRHKLKRPWSQGSIQCYNCDAKVTLTLFCSKGHRFLEVFWHEIIPYIILCWRWNKALFILNFWRLFTLSLSLGVWSSRLFVWNATLVRLFVRPTLMLHPSEAVHVVDLCHG